MRKVPKLFLVKGYFIRIIGLAIICMTPWFSFISDGEEYVQDIDLTMYFALAIGFAFYIAGIRIKLYAERAPSTLKMQLPQNLFWLTLISFSFIATILVGSLLRLE